MRWCVLIVFKSCSLDPPSFVKVQIEEVLVSCGQSQQGIPAVEQSWVGKELVPSSLRSQGTDKGAEPELSGDSVSIKPSQRADSMSLTLRELTIHKFRNVKPGTKLVFNEGFNVALGLNATGKSTLLDLIAAVICGDYRAYDEEVELDFLFSDGHLEILGEARSNILDLETSISGGVFSVGSHRKENEILECLHFTVNDFRYSIIQAEDGFFARWEGKEKLFLKKRAAYTPRDLKIARFISFLHGKVSDASGFEDLQYVFREPRMFELGLPLSHSFPFSSFFAGLEVRLPEGLEFFAEEIQDSSIPFKVSVRGIKGGEKAVRGFSVSFRRFLSSSLLNPMMAKKFNNDSSIEFDLTEQDLPFLQRFIEATRFVLATLRHEIIEREVGEESVRYTLGKPSIEFFKKNGSSVSHRSLSYGQKRLLSFLLYAELNPHFLVLDELANGMHHEWIELCMEDVFKRQSFLASQSPLLLDYLHFDSPEAVQASFIQCRLVEEEDGEEWMSWEQMSAEEAESFYRTYEAGYLHVSEILKNRGLW